VWHIRMLELILACESFWHTGGGAERDVCPQSR
jgi:hypothetical protein